MSVILATAGYDHKVRFWEAPSGICTRVLKVILSFPCSTSVYIFKNYCNLAHFTIFKQYPDSQVNKLEITPDKQFLAAGGNPHIRLYEIVQSPGGQGGAGSGGAGGTAGAEHQQPVLTLEGHTSSVTSLGFQRDGRYLFSGSEDSTIKLWDLRAPTFSRSFDCQGPVRSVTLRVDRDEIISGDANGYVKIWDLGGSGKGCIHQVQPRAPDSGGAATQSAIQAVDISEDSRTLAAVSNHGTVFVWDPTKPASSRSNDTMNNGGGNGSQNDPAEENVPHHQRMLEEHEQLQSSKNTNTSFMTPITKFRAHPLGSYCLHARISPDCRHLCTTGSDGTAKLWDTTTWELSQNLNKHTKWVWDAAFCADSSYLVTAGDTTARLWNLRTGEVVRQYIHQSPVTSVALNDSSV